MGLEYEKELDEIRRRKLMDLQQKMVQEQEEAEARKREEMQRQIILRRILTPEARQRLANLKMVRPEFAAQLEVQLVQIAQQGLIKIPIDDDKLKEILRKLQEGRREIRIRRM
ncbi:MAG: DNA-binding protein [Candidatus Bathyarchaeia archaeon]